ncbi:NlpC/P60 family protein [Embleya sp. NPDC055664]
MVFAASPVQAEPQPALQQAKEQVDALHEEAEAATERYNGAADANRRAQEQVAVLQQRLADKQAALARQREMLGGIAAAEYRGGGVDPSLRLLMTDDPQGFLNRISLDRQLSARQQEALGLVQRQRRELDQERREVAERMAELDRTQREMTARKQTVEAKLRQAQDVVNRLSGADRERLRREEQAERDGKAREAAAAKRQYETTSPATSDRAAAAVRAAYAQLGKPYRWAATGPDSFDCSGLTQFVWRTANVSLPRTSQEQVRVGRPVAKSELQPGDLVFFYSDLHHVGIYIGGGKMIHAPKPGSNVEILSIDVRGMPYMTAIRP